MTDRCPRCTGVLVRVPRNFFDRMISVVSTRHRYRCLSAGCGWEGLQPPIYSDRRRYAQPAYHPFNGFFGYSQQAYQPKVKKAKKKQYGGSYNTW